MNFNEKLISLRKSMGLSQEELGAELHVSRQTISKWESAQSYPDFQRLVLLSDYFGLTLDELVRDVDVADVRSRNLNSEKSSSSGISSSPAAPASSPLPPCCTSPSTPSTSGKPDRQKAGPLRVRLCCIPLSVTVRLRVLCHLSRRERQEHARRSRSGTGEAHSLPALPHRPVCRV